MKRLLVFTLVGLFSLVILAGCGAPARKDTFTVHMKKGTFEPLKFTIKQNTEVTFVNEDTAPHWPASDIHPTHEIYPEFDPKVGIAPGKEWVFVFDKVGIWRFHDHLNPKVVGVITVE